MVSPAQIRGARAMLGLTQAELAARANLSINGLINIERGQVDPRVSTVGRIQSALEDAGADFSVPAFVGVSSEKCA